MSDRTISLLAWIYCILVFIFAVVLAILNLRYENFGNDIFNILNTIFTFFTLTVSAIVGTLIVSRQPRNTVGWLMILVATLVIVLPLDIYFNNVFQPPPKPAFITLVGIWVYMWMWIWYIFPLLFIPLFFPTGRLLSPRWRWVVVMGVGLCLFLISFATFTPEFTAQDGSWSVPNPIGFINIDFPFTAWAVSLLTFAALSVVSLVLRYRRGCRIEKEQIKWLLYAVVLFFVIYSTSFLFVDYGGFAAGIVLDFAIILLPISIGLAILRYRLYDIDILIRKTLIYAVLTGILSLIYFGLVILLQSFVELGSNEQSPLIIVVSTLIIAALFSPLRRRVQEIIDRRFYRKKYDSQMVLAQFSQVTRDETEIDILTAELTRVVHETVQPEKVQLWISNPHRIK